MGEILCVDGLLLNRRTDVAAMILDDEPFGHGEIRINDGMRRDEAAADALHYVFRR
jgi:hypothetical protein